MIEVINCVMQLDPMEGFQAATDVRLALEPVLEKDPIGAGESAPDRAEPRAVPSEGAEAARAGKKRAITLVEPPGRAQQQLKDFFTKLGFWVLVTENAQRVVARFSTTPLPGALVISIESLGEDAVAAFNKPTSAPFFS